MDIININCKDCLLVIARLGLHKIYIEDITRRCDEFLLSSSG